MSHKQVGLKPEAAPGTRRFDWHTSNLQTMTATAAVSARYLVEAAKETTTLNRSCTSVVACCTNPICLNTHQQLLCVAIKQGEIQAPASCGMQRCDRHMRHTMLEQSVHIPVHESFTTGTRPWTQTLIPRPQTAPLSTHVNPGHRPCVYWCLEAPPASTTCQALQSHATGSTARLFPFCTTLQHHAILNK